MNNSRNTFNAMTVDVEDYFHVSAFAQNIDPKNWDQFACRVERNTRKLLELFASRSMTATFFVLGWVAERYPKLVEEIGNAGHEVASHGYSHQLVYRQTPEVFRDETKRSKQILEDIVQKPIVGYRAASYSITNDSYWALDILGELGFVYDSSIFPIRHDRYGIANARKEPHHLTTPSGHTLAEFPLSTAKLFGTTLPVAGGGYFRLFPYWLTRWGLGSINKQDQPFVFYLHPWEIDPEQPRVESSALSRFRHYNNLEKCEARLTKLIDDFSFCSMREVLSKLKLIDSQ